MMFVESVVTMVSAYGRLICQGFWSPAVGRVRYERKMPAQSWLATEPTPGFQVEC